MIYTLTTDIHTKLNNLEKVSKLLEMIEEKGNPVIILGDLFDTKSIIRAECLNLVNHHLKKSKLDWFIIVGNHDLYNVESEATDNSLKTLGNIPHVFVVDSPLYKQDSVLIPYIHDREKLTYNLRRCLSKKIILCHADIQGFKHGSKISESGVEITDFPKDIKVISGHYHSFQSKGSITYLGSPFSHTFSEANEDKYIGILDTETQNLELIKTEFPQHRSFDLICSSVMEENHQNIEKCLTETKKDDIIRIILKGNLENINKLDRSKFDGIKFVNEPDQTNMMGNLVVTEADSNEKQFENWAKEVKGLNKKTIKLGLEILEGVK